MSDFGMADESHLDHEVELSCRRVRKYLRPDLVFGKNHGRSRSRFMVEGTRLGLGLRVWVYNEGLEP